MENTKDKKKKIASMLMSFYQDELVSAEFYRFLGNKAKDEDKASFYEMADMEQEHARIWLEDVAGDEFPLKEGMTFGSKIRLFMLKLLAFFMPLSFMVNYLELGERGALQSYHDMLQEFSHGEAKIKQLIEGIMKDEILHEATLTKMILDSSGQISNLKEAIYGMTDSLVEILALVIGLASIMDSLVLIGLSGMLASIGGTFSMVSGAYLSVQTQNDIYEGKVGDLRTKQKVGSKYVAEDLKLGLVEKGLDDNVAEEIANKLSANDKALLGLTEAIVIEEEKGNPGEAAKTTGIYYILGALPAFLPFFLAIPFGLSPLMVSAIAVGLSALLAFVAGIFTAVLSGIDIGAKGIKNVVITIGAALATYAFGTLVREVFGITV